MQSKVQNQWLGMCGTNLNLCTHMQIYFYIHVNIYTYMYMYLYYLYVLVCDERKRGGGKRDGNKKREREVCVK